MLKSNWKFAYRNLMRRKSFLLINVFGLAVAIASSIIILLFARYELSYDSFHANADRINLVVKERSTAQGIVELRDTWVPLLPLMQDLYPGIEGGARIFYRERWVQADNQKFQETVTIADPAFLEIFSFNILSGDPGTALAGTGSAVITQSIARKYFGDENPVGQRLTMDFEQDFLVTAVMEDYPGNSSITPDIVVPFASAIAPEDTEANSNWGGSFLYTYLVLNPATDSTALESQFPDLIETQFGKEGPNGSDNLRFELWPLESLRNHEVNNDLTAYALLGVAFGIIMISCINFMNLATAQSMERGREVGVRKTLGAARLQLVSQFLGESMLISLIALFTGVVLAELMLPMFNALFELNLSLQIMSDLPILIMLIVVGLLAGFLSGTYPAFILSGFRITDSIKGDLRSQPHSMALRSVLSVLQFSLAIMLSISVLVIWQQVQYMKNSDLNFDTENILIIPASMSGFPTQEIAATRMEAFKQEVLQIPAVESVSSSMSVPGNYINANVFARPENWSEPQPLRMRIAAADDQYFTTFGMEFVEGRNFSQDFSTEENSIIINETAMRDMGWDTAIGKQVNDNWTIVGVVEDFHYQSLESEIGAIIHIYRPEDSNSHNFISLKLATDDVGPAIAALEPLWRELDPDRPFNYYFVDEAFEDLYGDVDTVSTILGYFCLLSLFIANLGLLGLSSYSVVQRSKEIGIRKVLGASMTQILSLLSKQFTRPVLLANLIAWPIAYLMISRWLSGFAYRIEVNWAVFLIAGLAVLLLALLTVCLQSYKTAKGNPVNTLRYE